LSVAEANLVLESLGQMPYARVYELVRLIQEQAQAQLAEAPAEARAPAEAEEPA
jgi:hypothetical protein